MKKTRFPQTITINQVAEHAGVSTATVSRVLNNSDAVSEKLKSQVRQAIQELGYRPNRAARHLRARKVRKVGVLSADIRNPFFTSILAGIENTLQKADYVLILGNSNEDPRLEQLHLQVFLEERVAGIILAAVTNSGARYQHILKAGIPILALDRCPDDLRVDSVTVNNLQASANATKYLLSLGHKNVAFISGPDHISTARLRREGYQQALAEAGNLQPIIEMGDFRQTGGYKAMQQLLTQNPRPSAVLVANNLMTLGALEAVHERGMKIPEDIALIGFDDMPWATSLQPPLTVVSQPTFELGVIAARLLLDRIENPGNPIQQVILDTQFIVRKSCGGSSLAAIKTNVKSESADDIENKLPYHQTESFSLR